MAKPRNDLVDRVVYLAVRFAAMLLHCWPVEWCLQGADLLGQVWYRLMRKHRERALDNLRHAFPEMTEARRREVAERSMRWMFQFGVDLLFTPRLVHVGTWAKVASLNDFQSTLRLLMDRHRGVILLTGHYGNWEVLGYLLSTLGFELTAVARPLDNPHLSDWVYGIRERKGMRILNKTGALAEIPDVLAAKGAVGLIADQNAGSKGMFVDFFGRKASTYKSIGLLAMRYDVPVVIGYARRSDRRFHFEVGTQDIIYPADWKDQADPLRYITQRYTKAIEDLVRAEPEQYLWVHRRWKTRPKDELARAATTGQPAST